MVTRQSRRVNVLHLQNANLEWKILKPTPDDCPQRQPQLAVPMNSDGSQSFTDNRDCFVPEDSDPSSDNIPLTLLREHLRECDSANEFDRAELRQGSGRRCSCDTKRRNKPRST